MFDPANEIKLTLERSISDGHSVENAALELNTLKMALNVRFHDIRQVLFPVLLARLDPDRMHATARAVFTEWAGLVKKFVHNLDDQMDSLEILEEHCTGNEALETVFMTVIKVLFDFDVLEEEVILDWHHGTRGSAIGVKVLPFIKWLETAEEESSEDGEE